MKGRTKARAEVRKLVEAGYLYDVVADRTGVAYATVTRWSRDGGWKSQLKPKPKLTPLTERRLRLMAKRGWSRAAIGKVLGINRETLKGLAADRGIVFATGTRPRALAAGLKLGKMKRWEAEIKRRSERDIAAMDEWAWA